MVGRKNESALEYGKPQSCEDILANRKSWKKSKKKTSAWACCLPRTRHTPSRREALAMYQDYCSPVEDKPPPEYFSNSDWLSTDMSYPYEMQPRGKVPPRNGSQGQSQSKRYETKGFSKITNGNYDPFDSEHEDDRRSIRSSKTRKKVPIPTEQKGFVWQVFIMDGWQTYKSDVGWEIEKVHQEAKLHREEIRNENYKKVWWHENPKLTKFVYAYRHYKISPLLSIQRNMITGVDKKIRRKNIRPKRSRSVSMKRQSLNSVNRKSLAEHQRQASFSTSTRKSRRDNYGQKLGTKGQRIVRPRSQSMTREYKAITKSHQIDFPYSPRQRQKLPNEEEKTKSIHSQRSSLNHEMLRKTVRSSRLEPEVMRRKSFNLVTQRHRPISVRRAKSGVQFSRKSNRMQRRYSDLDLVEHEEKAVEYKHNHLHREDYDRKKPAINLADYKNWRTLDVIRWFQFLNFPQYAHEIKRHNVRGVDLVNADKDYFTIKLGIPRGDGLHIYEALEYLRSSDFPVGAESASSEQFYGIESGRLREEDLSAWELLSPTSGQDEGYNTSDTETWANSAVLTPPPFNKATHGTGKRQSRIENRKRRKNQVKSKRDVPAKPVKHFSHESDAASSIYAGSTVESEQKHTPESDDGYGYGGNEHLDNTNQQYYESEEPSLPENAENEFVHRACPEDKVNNSLSVDKLKNLETNLMHKSYEPLQMKDSGSERKPSIHKWRKNERPINEQSPTEKRSTTEEYFAQHITQNNIEKSRGLGGKTSKKARQKSDRAEIKMSPVTSNSKSVQHHNVNSWR